MTYLDSRLRGNDAVASTLMHSGINYLITGAIFGKRGLSLHLVRLKVGLEEEKQVSRDPLCGNLFENMVVLEALKFRYNQSKRSNLFFYRDSNGNEVDLIAEQGRRLVAIEIKAGATINPDYFKGLRHFRKAIGDEWTVAAGVVYGGDELQRRSEALVQPALNCDELFAELFHV